MEVFDKLRVAKPGKEAASVGCILDGTPSSYVPLWQIEVGSFFVYLRSRCAQAHVLTQYRPIEAY